MRNLHLISQEDIIEIGLRTPYIFTSNKGGINWQWQIHTESTILNLVAGQAPKGPRKDQVRKNITLCTIVSSYEERRENIMDYLKGCTYNFAF